MKFLHTHTIIRENKIIYWRTLTKAEKILSQTGSKHQKVPLSANKKIVC